MSADEPTLEADERGQVDEPMEPFYEDGAFHIELSSDGWHVYDAYWNKWTLGPWDDVSVAIDACIVLSSAAQTSDRSLELAYLRLEAWPK